MDLGAVDKPEPPYRQVAARLRALIESGDLAPGARLPSEADLQKHYGLGRNAVRHALGVLAEDGLIVSRPAVGWFVADQ